MKRNLDNEAISLQVFSRCQVDMSELIDIHCHLYQVNKQSLDKSSYQTNPNIIAVSTALNQVEINWHLEQKIKYWFAGLHPQEWSLTEDKIKEFLDNLPYEKLVGIGEIGLDKRYKNLKKQINLLAKQMQISLERRLPSLYHLVGHEYEFIKVHKEMKLDKMKILHGFHSSFEVYKELDKLGFYFSLSERILSNSKHKTTINEIIKSRRYFLESDAADGGSLMQVKIIANQLESTYNINKEEIMQVSSINFRKLVKETSESISEIKFNN
jgi:Tat protein secretion system quality control protein TatD with DNase activity